MSRKALELAPRMPGQRATETDWQRLEREIAAKGEAVAGTPLSAAVAPVEASSPPDVQTSERPAPGLVQRRGRILADGSRRGARTLRRTTVYLPPELAQRLTVHSASTGRQLSELVAEAVAAYLDGRPV